MNDQNIDVYTVIAAQAKNLANQLMTQLLSYAIKVQKKYDYYNADNPAKSLGISVPIKLTRYTPGVGWASRAITTLSDRLKFDGFANDTYGMNEYFDNIYANDIIDKLEVDCLIAGCSFCAITYDNNLGAYTMMPFTAEEATGLIDEKSGLLKAGLAVTRWKTTPTAQPTTANVLTAVPVDYVVFTPQYTAKFTDGQIVDIAMNSTGRTLLHIMTHRRNTDRPMGKSRISKTVRRIIDELERVKQRYEIAQEFYSTPQRYINGLAQGASTNSNIDLALGKWLLTTKDDDGDKPDIGQLAQMSINQFSDAKKDLARDFCAETALTLRNLGYETGNPTSAESLKTMSDDLLLEAQACQDEIGEQVKQIAITLRLATDQTAIVPDKLKQLKPVWQPIFQSDAGAVGDAVYKLIQAMPELADTDIPYRMLGMGIREINDIKAKKAAQTVANSFGQLNTQLETQNAAQSELEGNNGQSGGGQ